MKARFATYDEDVDPDTGYFADTRGNFWSQETSPTPTWKVALPTLLNPTSRALHQQCFGDSDGTVERAADVQSDVLHRRRPGPTVHREPTLADLIDWMRGVDAGRG